MTSIAEDRETWLPDGPVLLLWNGLGIGGETCLPEEARTVAELSSTADAREGLAAVLGKRAPVFGGH